MTARGATPQLLLRAADGSLLVPPGGGDGTAGLLIWVRDAGVGVERVEVRASGGESRQLSVEAEAVDDMGHAESVSWPALAGR